jgi:quercetin dioxygenase-like cupin family protein
VNTRKSILIAAIGLAAVAILGVTAWASTGGGFTGTSQVRGTMSGDVHLNTDRIKFQTKDDIDVVGQTTTYARGGFSGWHTHPGFVLVIVESGAITLQVGCTTNTYSVGQAFHESGDTPIMARNLGEAPAVVRITYVVPKGSPVRTEVPLSQAPVC